MGGGRTVADTTVTRKINKIALLDDFVELVIIATGSGWKKFTTYLICAKPVCLVRLFCGE